MKINKAYKEYSKILVVVALWFVVLGLSACGSPSVNASNVNSARTNIVNPRLNQNSMMATPRTRQS